MRLTSICTHGPWGWQREVNIKTAVKVGFKQRKRLSHEGNKAPWDPSETSPRR
jgi:hypothetical protein